ncbi:MAG: HAMP domain-containing sensor histidine kinase [Candidatus Izemoplasma sp.]
MNKVTIKVFFATMLVIFITSLIPEIISYLSTGNFIAENDDVRPHFYMIVIAVFIMIMVFNFIMNQIIYKRINKLNHATKEVMKGNYDVEIEEGSNDEITEVIRNFNIMIKELKANEYQNKEFVRNFSHELKTPLSAIKGYSDLLASATLSKDEEIEYAKIISSEATRLTELSKNMLLISLVDSKVILPKQDNFNVSEQIRNIIQLMQLSWENKKIEFDLTLPDYTIVSNKELLYQVWMNLISNAVKFSPSNSKIIISLDNSDDKLTFLISNEGAVDSLHLDKLFDLFYVSEKSRDNTSSGVGLTLTKKIVSKLNGTIDVKSLNNEITFTVELPN